MILKDRIGCTGVTENLHPSKKSLLRVAIVRHRAVAAHMNTRSLRLEMRQWLLIWKDGTAPINVKDNLGHNIKTNDAAMAKCQLFSILQSHPHGPIYSIDQKKKWKYVIIKSILWIFVSGFSLPNCRVLLPATFKFNIYCIYLCLLTSSVMYVW